MIITRAPLRISFFGGGTDYPEFFVGEGGAVLATAIDKFTYVTASPFFSDLFDFSVRVSYSKAESARRVEEIEHKVFREALKLFGFQKDIELHTVADLPAFTGLGSSSSFTVALLQALHSFRGEYVPPLALAYEAIDVERRRVGDNVGCQDQVTAAVGGFNLIEFRGEDDIQVHRVPISRARLEDFQRHLVLVYTGITRRASDLVARQLSCLSSNREPLRKMRAMAERGWDILIGSTPLSAFGELLHEAWMAKRGLESSISNAEIDRMYEAGRQKGALGGKLLGAGGGGFLAFFAPPEKHERLQEVFAPHPTLDFSIGAPGSEVIFATS
jgi:D-glycero-alpha-D-manno-heptose-7-phosphate kinase